MGGAEGTRTDVICLFVLRSTLFRLCPTRLSNHDPSPAAVDHAQNERGALEREAGRAVFNRFPRVLIAVYNTLAHYLELLAGAGLLTGLTKYSGQAVRQRGSSPKLQVLNTALMSAQSGHSYDEARADSVFWGRLVESAIGAHLANSSALGECELSYWREGNCEVDFVVRAGRTLAAIEVKSGRSRETQRGLAEFAASFKPTRKLLVGADGIPMEEFLMEPVRHWIKR